MMGQVRLPSPLLLAVLACASLAMGCTHTQHVGLDPLEPAVQQRIGELSQQKQAWLKLTDGQRALVRGVAVNPDSTSWYTQHTGYRNFYAVPTDQVRSVRFKHRRSGAIEGLTLGSLVGAVGSFVLLLQSDSHSDAVRGITRILPLSGLIGFIGGAMRGERERYVFETPIGTPSRPVVPVVAEVREPSRGIQGVVEEGAQALDPLFAGGTPSTEAETGTQASDPLFAGEIHSKGKVLGNEKNLNEPAPAQEGTTAAPIARRTPRPPPSASRRPPPPGFRGWTLVVASLNSSQQLDATWRKYRARFSSLPVNVVENHVNGIVRYHVTVGQYETQTEAQLALRRLTRSLPDDTWLLHVRPGS